MPRLLSELHLLNLFGYCYIEEDLPSVLSDDEIGDCRLRRWHIAFPFTMERLYEGKNHLRDDATENSVTVLDAIIAQALFGRKTMMSHPWFRKMYEKHGVRLDNTPRNPPSKFVKLQDALLGRTGKYKPPQETTTTEDRSFEDLVVSFHSLIEEMNDTETKQHGALEDICSELAKSSPELRGILCGVRHSFQGRGDRHEERNALLSATKEYIEKISSGVGS